MRCALAVAALLAMPGTLRAEAVELIGTVCRTDRHVERLVVESAGARRLVALDRPARITFEGGRWEAEDLRPGDRVHLWADRDARDVLHPIALEVEVPASDVVLGALFPSHRRLIGRFAVREAKTEYFSLRLPGGDYVRVEAKSAYGPNGRVWVSTLRSGDLLEIDGTWTKQRELHASSIHVLTDEQPPICRGAAIVRAPGAALAERQWAEQRFLEGYDLGEPAPGDEGVGEAAGSDLN